MESPRRIPHLALSIPLLAAVGGAQTMFAIDLSPALDPDGSAADGDLVYATAVASSTTPPHGAPGNILGAPDYTGGSLSMATIVDFNGSVTVEMPCAVRDVPGVDMTVFGAQLDEDEGWDLFVGATASAASMTLVGSFAGSPSGQLNTVEPLAVLVDFAGTPLPPGARFVRMVKNEPDIGPVSFGFDYDAIGIPPVAGTEIARLGSPPNPAVLLPGVTSGPVVGATWDPIIDHAAFAPGAILDVLAVSLVSPGAVNIPTPAGTLLCDISVEPLLFTTAPGTPFTVPIPDDCDLVGVPLCTQGVSVDAGGLALTNALDIAVGSG